MWLNFRPATTGAERDAAKGRHYMQKLAELP
jgi:hypothetical protein